MLEQACVLLPQNLPKWPKLDTCHCRVWFLPSTYLHMLHGWTGPSESSQPLSSLPARAACRRGGGGGGGGGGRRRGGVTSSQPSTNSGVSRSTERWGAAESRRDGEWSWTFKTSRKTRRKRQPSNEMCVFDFQLNPDCELHHQGEFGSAWTRLIQSAQKSQELTSDRPEWLWSSDLLCSDVTVIRNKA